MRNLLTVLLLAVSLNVGAAETVVTGRVLDRESGRGVEFANVAALQESGKIASVCATDAEGKFSLNVHRDGKYRLSVSFVGYVTWEKDIDCTGKEISLGDIRLKQDSEALEAAEITGKTLIRRESDRIVYDVLSDPDAWRMNMSSFMSKIPGLETSSSRKLEYNGSPVARVLVDDKSSPLINEGRQYPMNFIRADYMRKIELVLPGSPEYENDEPILLITLDRELPIGFATEISASADTKNEYSVSPDAVINTPVVGVGINYAYSFAKNPALSTASQRRVFDNQGNELSLRESGSSSWSRTGSHKLGVNLFRSFLKKKLDVTFSMSSNYSNGLSETSSSSTETAYDGTRTESGSNSTTRTLSPFRFNAGVNATYNWGNGNNVLLRYTFLNRYRSSEEILARFPDGNSYTNTGSSSQQEHNVMLGLRLRSQKKPGLWSLALSTGYMRRDYDDNNTYGSGSITGMNYAQDVAYVNGLLSGTMAARKLMYSVGANLEYVNNDGLNLGNGNSLKYNEFNVIPRARLLWRIVPDTRLSLGYTLHRRRPNQQYLDPYRDESDPYNVKVGNPELKGEVTQNVRLTLDQDLPWKWFTSISLDGSYNWTGNSIESVSTTDSENIRTTTWMNIGLAQKWNMSLTMMFNPAKRISLRISGNATNNSYRILGTQTNSYWSFSVRQQCVARFKYFTLIEIFQLMPTLQSAQTAHYRLDPNLGLSISRFWKKSISTHRSG